jgi:hypothetical protein
LTARLLLLTLPALALFAADAPRPSVAPPTPVAPARELAGLHNVHRLTARVFSGATPEGDAGFASLRRLGVRTVLSVDGATPEVEHAAAFGLRYVHSPVGYDGIPPAEVARIARALRDLPGPVYVHCHHGQHRGPAAAVAALRCLGELTADEGVAALQLAGTDPKYSGLIALPHTTQPLSPAALDRVPAKFPARAATADLTQLMVKIDGLWDRGAAAVQLEELFRESARLPAVAANADLVKRFEAAAAAPLSRRNCTTCHATHRD